ncbi:MAG: glycosyltransferase family 39 protein [Terriglobia bacterium]
MKSRLELLGLVSLVFGALLVLHLPFLLLPYFWDEAGYYVPAALDFYRHGLLIPRLTLPTGHTPLVIVYLGAVWHLIGFSPASTRVAMILIAAAAVVATYALACQVRGREAGFWAAALLALSPLFFAQSSLVFLDLAAALFTTLAVLFALRRRWGMVALTVSLAVLSKETAIIVLPVVWMFMLFRARERHARAWTLSTIPVAVLVAWALYYRSRTGFWTGNAGYLQYNLYGAMTPLHAARSLVARIAEILVQGFNWVVVAGAVAGAWWVRRRRKGETDRGDHSPLPRGEGVRGTQAGEGSFSLLGPSRSQVTFGDFVFLSAGLIGVYIVVLSVVGGAILPRYMLPAFPVSYVLIIAFMMRLPKHASRALCLVALACFVSSWFINPPYPFPYEDNLAYASFIRLHQRAAKFLETLPGDPTILTAWPATDELKTPFLGYVSHPLHVVPVEDFTPAALADPPRFDVLYIYSRQWAPAGNWFATVRPLRTIARRFYAYGPAEKPAALAACLHLRLLKQFRERGQWVKIYAALNHR